MSVSQGRKAGVAGKILEGTIISTLGSLGFVIVAHPEFKRAEANSAPRPPRLLVKNMPYDTIYGTKGKTEFWLYCADALSTHRFPLAQSPGELVCRIECKWQRSAGSVDEKFPYLYLSFIEAMTEQNILLLMEAEGARVEAVRWLTNAIAQRPYANEQGRSKRIEIMGNTTFMGWAQDAFGS
ncbi:MAG: PD-(D/E)XK nuclease superfamily protein [Opitutaceae bacterium]